MADLFRQVSGSQSNQGRALRGTVKITTDGPRVLTEIHGTDFAIPVEHVIGNPVEGDPCLLVIDELRRGWLVTQGVTAAELAALQDELDAHEALTTTAHGGIVASTDPRLTDARVPTGTAGGELLGTYPNPMINVPLVASLPVSPVNGQEIHYLADATNEIAWHLKWRSATSKWIFLGGPEIAAEVSTPQNTASTTYADLATVGPAVTVPLAGDYYVRIEAGVFNVTLSANPYNIYTSYSVHAAAASDADAMRTIVPGDSGGADMQFVGSPQVRTKLKAGLSAGNILTMRYKIQAGGNTSQWENRRISILPRRVT